MGAAAKFPVKSEKSTENPVFRPTLAKNVPKRSRIPDGCAKIPYASEQGIFSAEQGIKSPSSGESREFRGDSRGLGK